MPVSLLTAQAFQLGLSRYQELHRTWIKISHRVGGQLPGSLLAFSMQRAGELDALLRCMEDEVFQLDAAAEDIKLISFNYQSMLSELWIGTVYEIFRVIKQRKLLPSNDDFARLAHELKLLRITLEKYEIADDRKLSGPLHMKREPPKNAARDSYVYLSDDPKKAHIMPGGISRRGSMMWQAIDVAHDRTYWIERRDLAERTEALWNDDSSGQQGADEG